MHRSLSILVSLTFLLLGDGPRSAAEETSTNAPRSDLAGKVVDDKGRAVPDTTVFIFSGSPRVGSSMLCPTCYPDCRKHQVTDANGNFRIQSLDPNLIFRLLLVNKRYKPQFVAKTDPANGPRQITVQPRKSDFPPHQALRGRIVGPAGQPISQAVVNFDFFGGQEANCGGQCEGVDLVAVTDEDGRFVIGSEKKFDWMTVAVESQGFARRKFFQLKSEHTHELKMTEGAAVTGRIVKNGKPIKGIGVGLVSVDRSENFTGNFDTFTNDDGRFSFLNIPPNQMYYAYSLLDLSDGDSVVPARKVRITGDGSAKDLGDLALIRGVQLHGKVVLSNREPIPPNTRIILSRGEAWDSKLLSLGNDGSFATSGLPNESFSLSLHIPGYRFADSNKSLDRLNGGNLVGRIESDASIEILLEPGEFQPPDFTKPLPPDAQPTDKPMVGVIPSHL